MIHNVIIELEGQDQIEKSLIKKHINKLSKHAYIVNARGILSLLVDNDKINRNREYMLYYKPLIILLDSDKGEYQLKSQLNYKNLLDYVKDQDALKDYAQHLEKHGVKVLRFNTTELTPYKIAQKIVDYMATLNQLAFACPTPFVVQSLQVYNHKEIEVD